MTAKIFKQKYEKEDHIIYKKFLHELNILKKLNHPNLVKLYGITTSNPYFLIMENTRYGSVLNFLSKYHKEIRINFSRIIKIAEEISNGLNYK